MQVLKSVGVLSIARIMGLIYGCLGLLFAPLFLLFAILGSVAGQNKNPMAGVLGIVFAIATPFLYGLADSSWALSVGSYTIGCRSGLAGLSWNWNYGLRGRRHLIRLCLRPRRWPEAGICQATQQHTISKKPAGSCVDTNAWARAR